MKKVMVFGTFDKLHKGHLNFFSQAEKYGKLVVVVARDKTVLEVKGKKAKNNEKKRLKQVRKHSRAILGMIKDKYKIIKKEKPDVICLGYDQKSFIKGLKKFKIKIVKLKAYKAHKYKSSKL